MKSNIDTLMAYENGELNDDEVIEFFQDLIDTELAWQLQGHYGRTARHLIEAGLCHLPTKEHEHG